MSLHWSEQGILVQGDIGETHKKRTLTTSQGRSADVYDQECLVFHKKQRKYRRLKDLGSGMVLCVQRDALPDVVLDEIVMQRALFFYPSFDEETGQISYFYPGSGTQRANFVQQHIGEHEGEHSGADDKGHVAVAGRDTAVSLLYGCAQMYGQRRLKGDMLQTVVVILPAVGQYGMFFDEVIAHIEVLRDAGCLVQMYRTDDALHVSVYDPHLLDRFAQWSGCGQQSVARDHRSWMRSQLIAQHPDAQSLESALENAMFVAVQ